MTQIALIKNLRLPRFASGDRLEACPTVSGLARAKASASEEHREPNDDGSGD